MATPGPQNTSQLGLAQLGLMWLGFSIAPTSAPVPVVSSSRRVGVVLSVSAVRS
jgi:hypothetical protein